MPLVSQKHVERSVTWPALHETCSCISFGVVRGREFTKTKDMYLEELLRKSGPEDLQNAARLASQGPRSFVWREGLRLSPEYVSDAHSPFFSGRSIRYEAMVVRKDLGRSLREWPATWSWR